jgi:cytochrome c oxidase assembly protein subunit 15
MNEPALDNQSNRMVATWLLICCALVFAMVILGGVTRLTGSGLSMVDWRPITGVLPPLSDSEWQSTFEMYQQSPEFQKVNSHMDVHDFKGIFWLEYLHRLLGRTIGIVFLAPFLFFVWAGHIRKRETPRYLLMFILGGLQGVLGWYMVKSGLSNNPHVSQYRLTAHLLAALTIYAYMFWVALGLLYPQTSKIPHRLYRRTLALMALITLTVASGGFVAGLKAGHIFNTFPLMGGKLIPDGLFAMQPAWRNLFDNMVTVQFDHRWLAITTFFSVIAYWFSARHADMSDRLRKGLYLLVLITCLQVILGISTLMAKVPVFLGSAHQGVALLLFTTALYLVHGYRSDQARA